MKDRKVLRKIQRVYQHCPKRTVKGEVRYDGPYWFGYWEENGKHCRAFLGKELPKSLNYLIEGRYRRGGRGQYVWPARKG